MSARAAAPSASIDRKSQKRREDSHRAIAEAFLAPLELLEQAEVPRNCDTVASKRQEAIKRDAKEGKSCLSSFHERLKPAPLAETARRS